jgi:hypothetical protein
MVANGENQVKIYVLYILRNLKNTVCWEEDVLQIFKFKTELI